MRKNYKWVALNHKGNVIAQSGCRDNLFHVMRNVLGIDPCSTSIARVCTNER